jgi:hypothetical protein
MVNLIKVLCIPNVNVAIVIEKFNVYYFVGIVITSLFLPLN